MARISIKCVTKETPGADGVYTYTIKHRGATLVQDSRVIGDRAQAKREAEFQAEVLGLVDGIDF